VIWNDDVGLVQQVESRLVEEDGLKLVDGLASVEDQEAWPEDDLWVFPGSPPRRLSWWIRLYPSSVSAFLLD
jgi:hypothetical protein